jgi:glycine betaine transporter
LQIQWVGAVVVGIYLACLIYVVFVKRDVVMGIRQSPEENALDVTKIEDA